jgi:type IV pilus assembly protein PilQ
MNGHRLLPSLLLTALLLPAAEVRALERVDLRVLRAPGALELVLDGMGPQPEIQKRATPDGWTIEVLTDRPGQLNGGARFLTLQEAGIDTVGLDGGDRSWRLQVNGRGLGAPLVSADGTSVRLRFAAQPVPRLTAGSYDLSAPGRVPQEPFVPPLRRRAVAPPGGDMAIGTIAMRGSHLSLPGAGYVQRMQLHNTPAKDVLMFLARAGGYNAIFASAAKSAGTQDGSSSVSAGQGKGKLAGSNDADPSQSLITVDFRRQSVEASINHVLAVTGLKARLNSRTIVIGADLPGMARNLVTKTVRLNQVSAARAAEFLTSQGATYYRTQILEQVESKVDPASENVKAIGPKVDKVGKEITIKPIEAEQAGGALPLKGLTISPDDRTELIALTGEPNLVSIAEAYLRQLDVRRRQVAVRVQVLDVNLNDEKSIENSFATRLGNTFIVSRNGQMLVNFGGLKPPSTLPAGLPGEYGGANNESPLVGVGRFNLPGQAEPFFDSPRQVTPLNGQPTDAQYGRGFARPNFGPFTNPAQPGVVEVSPPKGVPGTVSYEPPKYTWKVPQNFQYPANRFYDYVTAQIQSSNTKVLADPVLLVQEGEGSSVDVATTYTTKVNSTTSSNSGTVSCDQVKERAGLVVNVGVSRIDDNGFVSMKLTPSLTAPIRPQAVTCNSINYTVYDLVLRKLQTGDFRVRDGQTLILTGVIEDDVRQVVAKWPVFGDLPFLGQFFRSSQATREKRELVIVVTPRIIDDEQGGAYGYGYSPASQEAREFVYGR